jgi:hypothetical protein
MYYVPGHQVYSTTVDNKEGNGKANNNGNAAPQTDALVRGMLSDD